MQKIMLEAVNNDTKESATIGEYTVDYEAGTVTETSFEKKIFKNLFADEEETTVQNNEPSGSDNDENASDDDVIIDLNDDDFWDSILNGY